MKRSRWERKPGWKQLSRKSSLRPVSSRRAAQRSTFNQSREAGESCFWCGKVNPGGFLDGDHWLEASRHPQLKGDPVNRVPTCRPCHQKVTEDRTLKEEGGKFTYEQYLAAKRHYAQQGVEVDGYGRPVYREEEE